MCRFAYIYAYMHHMCQSLVTNSTQAHQLKELSSAICASDSARKKKISLEKKEKEEKKGKKD